MTPELPTRRRLLRTLGSTAVLGVLAGCGGNGDSGDGESGDDSGGSGADDTDTATDTATPTQTATPTATPQTETVQVGPNAKNQFEPSSLEIATGTTVTFVWKSSGHSLVVDSQPDGASWEGVDETKSEGYEHSHTFEAVGTYEYHCGPHETFGMEGTITVTE